MFYSLLGKAVTLVEERVKLICQRYLTLKVLFPSETFSDRYSNILSFHKDHFVHTTYVINIKYCFRNPVNNFLP